MDSSLLPPPETASTSAAPAPPAERDESEKEMVHKTKVIQFLGRTTPIILQNDNGPCPLLAICNVLSLKNSLNLSPDIPEVSQEKLLSLVAERLIDSNTNTDNKDTGYVENQLQNIADAIDLLPRLATGIDVNIKFRRIDDFEFTPECAIFDLLDIPLYHGWIVDPQDHETSGAISSKSYNTLMGELVSLETKQIEGGQKKGLEDESVDFVAATTAALGIPSPNLSRGQSFDDSPHKSRKGDIEEEAELIRALKLSEMDNSDLLADGMVADVDVKGSAHVDVSDEITHFDTVGDNIYTDLKTATVLSNDNDLSNYKVDLKLLSQEDVSSSLKPDLHNRCSQPSDEESKKIVDSNIGSDMCIENGKVEPISFGQDFVTATTAALVVPSSNLSRGQSLGDSPHKSRKGDRKEEAELSFVNKSQVTTHLETVEENITTEVVKTARVLSNDNDLSNLKVDLKLPEVFSQEDVSSSSKLQNSCTQLSNEESRKIADVLICSDTWIENGKAQPIYFGHDSVSASDNSQYKSMSGNHSRDQVATTSNPDDPKNHHYGCEAKHSSSLSSKAANFDSSIGQMHLIDEPEAISSSADDSEPIYEGEECILDSGTVVYENREPIYEGEVVLAGQVDTGYVDDGSLNSKDRISIEQGEIIKSFMKNSASQLTVYGLFSLQDQVKERELCVFFRNNHFNTMFKYEGELYILATDQGFINQPDLVWEKLNEVNGDTVYMTSNFKEFKMDDHSGSTWDEQNAVTSTADYLATIDSSQPNSSFNTDLQLAIALQQQEFDQQEQEQQQEQREQQRQRSSHQPAVSGTSRLVTGPHSQVPRSSGKHTGSSKHDSKSKEKCIVM